MKLKDAALGFTMLAFPGALAAVGAGCGSSSSTSDDAGASCDTDASHTPATGTDGGGTGDDSSIANGGDAGQAVDGHAADGQAAPFTASNVPASVLGGTGDVTVTGECTIDTDKLTFDCVSKGTDGGLPFAFVGAMQGDGSRVSVLSLGSLTVNQSAQVTVRGSVPLILWAERAVNIQGSMDAAPSGGAPNAGGPEQTLSGAGGGAGGGAAGQGSSYIAGGGGGYCGLGGAGANSTVDAGPAAGGRSYGSATLVPLVAGSAGGGQGAGHEGGRGGGAIQIAAGTSILVGTNGVIDVPGNGATGNGGGGGSGGAIFLEAPSVTINGVLAANGGGAGVFQGGGGAQSGQPNATPAIGQSAGSAGGSAGAQIDGQSGQSVSANATSGGGGAAGRIRIDSLTGMATVGATATLSPALTTTCVTQGTLN